MNKEAIKPTAALLTGYVGGLNAKIRRLENRQVGGPGSRPKTPGMYIGDPDERGCTIAFRGARQLHRRTSRRLLQENRSHRPCRRLHFHPRRWPRHPGRCTGKVENARGGNGADQPPRRRQIRPGRLQVFRRHARRRRQMRQRPLRLVQGGSLARRQGLLHGVRAGHHPRSSRSSARANRTGTLITFKPDPKFSGSPPNSRRTLAGPPARTGVPESRPRNHPHRRARRKQEPETFLYKDGIEEFVKQLGRNKQVLHPKPIVSRGKRTKSSSIAPDAIQRQYNYTDQILCFTNTITNPDGGTHLDRLPLRADPRHQPIRKTNNLFKEKDPPSPATTCAKAWSRHLSVKLPTRVRVPDQGQAPLARGGRHRFLH
jgi:hypothetical protein